MDSDLGCNLISGFKPHARHMVGYLVRILFYDTVHAPPVMLVYPCCQSRRYSVFLQIDHCLAHVLLFFYLSGNLPGLALADSFDLSQAFRLFLDDAESVLLKLFYNPSSQGCANPFHRSGSQVPLNGNQVLRLADFGCLCLKLQSVQFMGSILSL